MTHARAITECMKCILREKEHKTDTPFLWIFKKEKYFVSVQSFCVHAKYSQGTQFLFPPSWACAFLHISVH